MNVSIDLRVMHVQWCPLWHEAWTRVTSHGNDVIPRWGMPKFRGCSGAVCKWALWVAARAAAVDRGGGAEGGVGVRRALEERMVG